MTTVRKSFNRSGLIDVLLWLLFLCGAVLCLYSFFYEKELQTPEQGSLLGTLEIPNIEVSLLIYEGTSDEVLENGVGHVRGSACLGEGGGSHCLLAGHRGLPNKPLLTRLGEIKIGDCFFITQKETFTYRVCNIQVIHPEDTGRLKAVKEKELVSLITCTPYGINTHRLVVTGERMK